MHLSRNKTAATLLDAVLASFHPAGEGEATTSSSHTTQHWTYVTQQSTTYTSSSHTFVTTTCTSSSHTSVAATHTPSFHTSVRHLSTMHLLSSYVPPTPHSTTSTSSHTPVKHHSTTRHPHMSLPDHTALLTHRPPTPLSHITPQCTCHPHASLPHLTALHTCHPPTPQSQVHTHHLFTLLHACCHLTPLKHQWWRQRRYSYLTTSSLSWASANFLSAVG